MAQSNVNLILVVMGAGAGVDGTAVGSWVASAAMAAVAGATGATVGVLVRGLGGVAQPASNTMTDDAAATAEVITFL